MNAPIEEAAFEVKQGMYCSQVLFYAIGYPSVVWNYSANLPSAKKHHWVHKFSN